MTISDRFTDYGITGAFFLLGQLILLVLWGLIGWINALALLLKSIPQVLQPSAISLLVAFAIIGIFFFGLVLDLVAISKQEVPRFKEHMRRNRIWLLLLIQKFPDYFPAELSALISEWSDPNWHDSIKSKQEAKQPITFIYRLQSLWDWLNPIPSGEVVYTYHKLRNFFFSYPLIYSAGTQFDNLSDGIHLWRTSRALFTSIVLLACETSLGFLVWFFEIFSNPRMLPSFNSVIALLSVWVILIGFAFITRIVALNAFSRMCDTMFALAYLSYHKNEDNGNSSGQSNPS